MTAKHSPATSLPWETTDTCSNNVFDVLRRASPSSIKKDICIGNAQDAAYIVHAANAYPKLIEALRVSLRVSSLPFDHADKRANPERLRAILRELGEAE